MSWPTSSPAIVPAASSRATPPEPELEGYMLSVGCCCGVTFLRWVTREEAMREMVLSDLLALKG